MCAVLTWRSSRESIAPLVICSTILLLLLAYSLQIMNLNLHPGLCLLNTQISLCCYLPLKATVVKCVLKTSLLHKISITEAPIDDFMIVIMCCGFYTIIKMESRQKKAAPTTNNSRSHPCISERRSI